MIKKIIFNCNKVICQKKDVDLSFLSPYMNYIYPNRIKSLNYIVIFSTFLIAYIDNCNKLKLKKKFLSSTHIY